MAKFLPVKTRESSTYYINVETVRYVVQNPQQADRSMIRFVGEEHTLTIEESAVSFIGRASAD